MTEQAAQELLPGIFMIPGPTAVGAVCTDKAGVRSVYLIDSGTCPEDAERIYGVLATLFGTRFILKAVINTHSHADHSGGNAYLAKKTGCSIWMPLKERGSMENTLLQASVAWGGYPLPELQTPYYVPEQCPVSRTISEKDVVTFEDGKQLSFIALPGHYFEMTGVVCKTADGRKALFAGDALFGRKVIGRFSIPFMYDIGGFMDSLDKLSSIRADWYVPSHGAILQEIEETVEMNKIAVLETITCILSVLSKSRLTAEELLTAVADINGIPLKLPQYVLIGSTLRSFLAYLNKTGRAAYTIENNRMLWYATAQQPAASQQS